MAVLPRGQFHRRIAEAQVRVSFGGPPCSDLPSDKNKGIASKDVETLAQLQIECARLGLRAVIWFGDEHLQSWVSSGELSTSGKPKESPACP